MITNMEFLQFFARGGWMMIPILAASLVTVALIIEHTMILNRAKKNLTFLWAHPLKSDQLLTRAAKDPVVLYLNEVAEEQLQSTTEKLDLAEQIIATQERRISWLGTIASIAPLLGLLGTVSGMINIFFRIAGAPPQNPLQDLSHGISEAMIATGGGLIVAIVAALAQHVLMNTNDDISLDLAAWIKKVKR
jgi:biopolymer transport protein ExbB